MKKTMIVVLALVFALVGGAIALFAGAATWDVIQLIPTSEDSMMTLAKAMFLTGMTVFDILVTAYVIRDLVTDQWNA